MKKSYLARIISEMQEDLDGLRKRVKSLEDAMRIEQAKPPLGWPYYQPLTPLTPLPPPRIQQIPLQPSFEPNGWTSRPPNVDATAPCPTGQTFCTNVGFNPTE